MPTTVILLRHAQSVWNAAGRWQGHADPELSDLGREQAQRVAERLSSWPINHVYTSDLRRAAHTAEAIAAAHGMTPIIDPVLRERDIGAWEGLTLAEIQAGYPEEWRQLEDHKPALPPGAEPVEQLYERAAAALKGLVERHPDEMIVVVSHGGTITATLSAAIGLPPHSHGTFGIRGHTGLSVVEVGRRRTRLTLVNDTSHLGGHLPG